MLELNDKARLYHLLTERFPFDQSQPLARVALYLSQQGVRAIDFGYAKMKSLLQELPEFLSLTDVMLGDQPQQEVRLHVWSDAPGGDASSKARCEELTPADREEIYHILSAAMEPESTITLAAAGNFLAVAGRTKEQYGFSKLRKLFENLGDFVTVFDARRGGEMHAHVTLHAVPQWDESRSPARCKDGGEADRAAHTAQGRHRTEEARPAEVRAPHWSDQLPERLEGNVFLPPKTLQKLSLALTGVEARPSGEILEALSDGYKRARASDGLYKHGESYVFNLHKSTPDGVPVSAAIKRSDYADGYPWYLNYAGPNRYALSHAYPEDDLRVDREASGPAVTHKPHESVANAGVSQLPAPASATLTQEDMREIYLDLTTCLPLEEKLHMATVSLKLHETGHPKEQYGFTRMKAMLQALSSFMSLEDVVMGGVPQVLVTLHAVAAWDDARKQAAAQNGEAPVRGSAERQRFSNLPERMEGHIFLTPKTLQKLNLALTGVEARPSDEVIDILCRSYRRAKESGEFFYKNGAYIFEVDLTDLEGNPIGATVKRSDFTDGLDWYLNYAGPNRYAISKAPGKMLEQFAFLGSWPSFLEELASKALPEPWDFGDGEKSYSILKKYIQYTFYRLHLEDKICISDDKTFAAFNTGLVTPHYDDLYACFEASETDEHATGWRFLEFSTAAVRGIGKRLVDAFNPLPQPPSYFARKEDLLFDLEKELHTDYDHILLDNISRLPLEFLEEECRGVEEAMELVSKIHIARDWHQRARLYGELSDCIAGSTRLFIRLRNRLEDAIKLARKKVRWNFKTAIPCYFPTRNVMSLMLPLALLDDTKADVALVVELTRSGNYQGQTILTLQQAYLDGRLLCRPNSEWLDTRDISVEEADGE